MNIDYPVISADSHVTEAPNTYIDYIDPRYRETAPRVVETDDRGDVYMIDGMSAFIPMGLIAAAGQRHGEINLKARYSDLHRSGYDARYRVADQDRDGVACEVIYPSVGMVLCGHPDLDYQRATMAAYNRWLAEYCAVAPDRLIGIGQSAVRTPKEAVDDLQAIKDLGLRGVMLTADPPVEDYDSPVYDELWDACVDLELVPSFHVLTGSSAQNALHKTRGPKLNSFMPVVWANQQIMGMLVLGGVFERNPQLRVVCVEADAGWVPHFTERMDHYFDRHRGWLKGGVERKPSTYFSEHIYLTFQDDAAAFANVDRMNWRRLLWANDFPHSDSTWPWSRDVIAEQTADLTDEQRRAILCENTAELYGVDTSRLPTGAGAASV